MQVGLLSITLQSLFFAFLDLGLTITLRGCDINLQQGQDWQLGSQEQTLATCHKPFGIELPDSCNKQQDCGLLQDTENLLSLQVQR